ncbi:MULTISPECIES: ParB/RepB/Spo0J family partition protein [unclassified Fibrobacter]|uniref:ParB/RepB/Spo0J family partition protein n=1 Tax=unclassified Fibrobacter TaxID=2634177 RepID=UPI000918473C|nr:MULTISPECIES: ParB/RepB/Spo0J family partition protein [unclassified Fibrobacter]OWV05309.1 hypothetical protein B7993_08530 [Fibrobacter sp. UWH3]SHL29269.1 ParB/RepB/Spo0J family partition protein [Fibrobacter sp. UWH6]
MKTQLDMRTIAVAKIIPNQNNPRSEIGDVSDLEASIKAHGLISPLTVRWNGIRFEVVAGSRRLKALQNLGIDKVACNVIDGPEDKLFEIATAENVSRKNMSPSDECKAIQKMIDNGTDIYNIAAQFGRTPRWVIGRLKMVQLGDEILKMLDEGEITLAHAEILTMADSDEDAKRFAEEAKYETPDELRDMILAEKKNLAKAPFDVAKICKKCEKQTITQQDIFGDVTDSFCRDGKCYQQNIANLIELKKKECEDLGMISVEGDASLMHSFQWYRSEWIPTDGEHTEEEDEIIKKLKEADKHPYFLIDTTGNVFAKWHKTEVKNDEDDEEETVKKPSEYERNRDIMNIVKDKETELIRGKVEELLRGISDETAALILAGLQDTHFNYQEVDADGNEEEVEDSPLNHINECQEDYRCKDEGPLSWVQQLCLEVIYGLRGYNGIAEEHREYFGIDHEKIVEEATKEYEEEQE